MHELRPSFFQRHRDAMISATTVVAVNLSFFMTSFLTTYFLYQFAHVDLTHAQYMRVDVQHTDVGVYILGVCSGLTAACYTGYILNRLRYGH